MLRRTALKSFAAAATTGLVGCTGGRAGGTSSNHAPAEGPFPITIGLQSLSVTLEWKADECPQFDVLVAVTPDGQLEVEREACIK